MTRRTSSSSSTLAGKALSHHQCSSSLNCWRRCGHCKRLKPTWDQLGEHFADLKDRVTIAKMEATENDLPPSVPFRISGFPTLKFKKAGSKEFIDYDGDRTLESLVAFVEENASNSLEKKNETVTPPPVEAEHAQEPIVHDHHDEL